MALVIVQALLKVKFEINIYKKRELVTRGKLIIMICCNEKSTKVQRYINYKIPSRY
jgi:hypothetical protein